MCFTIAAGWAPSSEVFGLLLKCTFPTIHFKTANNVYRHNTLDNWFPAKSPHTLLDYGIFWQCVCNISDNFGLMPYWSRQYWIVAHNCLRTVKWKWPDSFAKHCLCDSYQTSWQCVWEKYIGEVRFLSDPSQVVGNSYMQGFSNFIVYKWNVYCVFGLVSKQIIRFSSKWLTMKHGYYISAKFDLKIMTKGIAE